MTYLHIFTNRLGFIVNKITVHSGFLKNTTFLRNSIKFTAVSGSASWT